MTLEDVSGKPNAFPGFESKAAFQRQAVLENTETVFPGVVTPPRDLEVHEYVKSINAISPETTKQLLRRHGGALLLRGFKVSSAQEFSELAHALHLGPKPHQEVGRPPRRTVLAKGVSTANEGPPDSPIWVHNEYGWSTVYPSYVLFFALRASDIGKSTPYAALISGGETPINSGIELASRLSTETPSFYQQLSSKV
jgi:hypothetical protein